MLPAVALRGKTLIWNVAFEFLSQDASVKICSSCMVEILGTWQSGQMLLKRRVGIGQSWLSEIWSPDCSAPDRAQTFEKTSLLRSILFYLKFIYLYVSMCICIYVLGHGHDVMHEWKGKQTCGSSALLLVGPGDQTQFFRFGSLNFLFVCLFVVTC